MDPKKASNELEVAGLSIDFWWSSPVKGGFILILQDYSDDSVR